MVSSLTNRGELKKLLVYTCGRVPIQIGVDTHTSIYFSENKLFNGEIFLFEMCPPANPGPSSY